MKTAVGPFDGRPSQHPVDRGWSKDSFNNVTLGANAYTALYMSNWDNSWSRPADQINCVECHDANANGGIYPNHPLPGTGARAAGANPYMLKNTTAMDNGHAPNSFCMTTCHAGTATGTSGWKMGHYGWGSFDNAGTLATLKEHDGTPLKSSKCSDCHETHSSSVKPDLMGEGRQSAWTVGSTNSYYNPAACTQCHVNTTFLAAGHGKSGINLNCGNCHEPSVSHRDQSNPKRLNAPEASERATLSLPSSLGSNGIDDDFDGVIDNPQEAAMQPSGESMCSTTCHTDLHIHGGDISGTPGTASCSHCHDPHGKGVGSNVMMVRQTVMGRPTTYLTSGTDLYRPDATSICDNPNCHAKPLGNTATAGTILGDVQEHKDANVGYGTVCTTCHNHFSSTGGSSFAPVCNSCHAYPGQSFITGTHVLSPVHNLHAGLDNTGGYAFPCSTCHYKYDHNRSLVNNAGEWLSRFQSNQVNIKFDGTWNPKNANGPLYAGVAADNTIGDNVYAPGVGGTGVCAGLYCHGNSAAVASWPAGSNPTPSWNTASTGACGTCHKVLATDPPTTFAHAKHADNTVTGYAISCRKCHYQTTGNGLTITSRSAHLNRQSNVTFDTTDALVGSGSYNGTVMVGDSGTTTGTCSNIFCHSPGTRMTPPFDNGALGVPDWKQGALACNACHGATGQAGILLGMPAYANGSPKVNTHAKHLSDQFACQVCHWSTTTTGNTITGRSNHVNAVYNAVNDNVASHAFTYASPNCSAAVCHGGFSSGPNLPAWGQGPYGCDVCHRNTGGAAAAADTDDFSWNSGTMSKVRDSEWTTTGHGRTSGTYNSGRSAANFTSCTTNCHTSGVPHNTANNPFRLTDKATLTPNTDFNDTVDPRSLKDNRVCLDCHSATGATPSGSTLHVENNHFGLKHSGAGAQSMGGSFCWDCHDPHGDPNDYMIHDNVTKRSDGQYGVPDNAAGSRVATTFSRTNLDGAVGQDGVYDWGDYVDNVSTVTGLCQVCHSDPAGAAGSTSGGAEFFSPTRFTATHNKTAGVQGDRCTACHLHSTDFKAGCNDCHGAAGYPYGPPPGAPVGGNQAWSPSVDNAGNLAGVGNHRSGSPGITLSSHDPYMGGSAGCAECHTGTPGLGATHNVAGEMSATMTNIANHGWTGQPGPAAASWSAGAITGAGGSVVDDSCSNVNCHSPYYNSNAAPSGTPRPYTRYWVNQTLWNCYTCHAYDGRSQNSGAAPRPGGTDNIIATGAHSTHISANYHYMDCTNCHPNQVGNNNHKSGYYDWSFSAAPNPYTGNTPSTSVPTGTQAPTDGDTGAGHRAYVTCGNVYCHSTVQTSPPGGTPTYRAPRWDNSGTGVCGTCHDVGWRTIGGLHGSHNNDGGPQISTGSHLTHVNSTSYAISCDTCHGSGNGGVGGGSGCSQGCHFTLSPVHSDGQVRITMGRSWTTPGRNIVLTDNLTIFDNTGTHGSGTDDRGAAIGADGTYGACWGGANLYCHSNGAGGAPLVNPARWGQTNTTCTYCHDRQGPSTNLSTRHRKHTDNTALTGYNFTCDECHAGTVANDSRTTLSVVDNHVNGTIDVAFGTTLKATTVPIGGAYTQGTDNCANTYCHGDGSSIKNGGTVQANSIRWDNTTSPLPCNSCHGIGGPASGSPNYTTSGTRRNSHGKHTQFGCQTCHSQTTTTGTTITAADNHVNGIYNVGGAGFAYDNSYMQTTGSTCSFTNGCHGNVPNLVWGSTLTGFCFDCHQGAEPAWKPMGASDGIPNAVDNASYFQSGHGRTLTNYPVSGNVPAGKWNNVTGAGCYRTDTPNGCHDSGALHTPTSASDPYRLGATYQDNTTLLCLTCHGTSGGAVTQNMAQHAKTITGSLKTWPNNYDWKCVDCHDPHGDGTDAANRLQMIRSAINQPTGLDNANVGSNTKGSPLRAPGWTAIAFTSTAGFGAGSYAISGTSNWGICEGCHRQTDTYNQAADNVNHSTARCTMCHDHAQGFKSSCDKCHGDIGGTIRADGTFFPPEGPTAARSGKTYTWTETNATPSTRGDHLRHAGSGYYGKGCAMCHVAGYGSDAGHNNNKTNATMTNLNATYGTWAAGASAGYVSVTDDSCSNITCHSPYSTENPANVFRSATPFTSGAYAYRRYWVDNVSWNCYTCHAYDGRTQNTGPVPRPGGTDNTMGTGSHTKHAGTQQMACTRCHPSGSYTVNHKNGFVDWSFTGAPNPFGSTPAYSVASGTRAPTDNAAGRLYGTCGNLYCHSAGHDNTAPAGYYKTIAWGGAAQVCSGCHGNAAYDNANIRYGMPDALDHANSHARHVVDNRYECSVCHFLTATGSYLTQSRAIAGTPNAYHVNGLRNVSFDGAVATGSYDNGAKTCTVSCHGSDTPVWGATLTNGCLSCHSGTEQIYKPQYDYGTPGAPNPVDRLEYLFSGHGRSGSNYSGSSNLPAGFSNFTTAPVACYVCHSQAASHTTKSVNDPFRLGSTTDGTLGGVGGAGGFTGAWADNTDLLCLGCHGTSAQRSGHDNAAKGTGGTIDAQAHARGITGTKYTWPGPNYPWKCVDCHDPHGDGNSGAERYMMIRSGINAPINNADTSIGSDGKSRTLRTDANVRSVTFNSLAGYGAGSYAQSGNGTGGTWGPCEVCHTQTTAFSRTLDNTASHASRTNRCTTCHPHKSGFAATACKGCHGPDSVATGAPEPTRFWTTSGHGRFNTGAPSRPIECEDCHDTGYLTASDHKTSGVAGNPPHNINTLGWPGKSPLNADTNPNANTAHLVAGYIDTAATSREAIARKFDNQCSTACHTPGYHRHEMDNTPPGVMRFGDSGTKANPKLYEWYAWTTSDPSNYPNLFYQSRSIWIDSDIRVSGLGDNTNYGLCVSCHDPHGTGVTDTSGYPGLGVTNHMLRGNWLMPSGPVTFCNNSGCHGI
jgi:predicted CxxxxCH...CXXCH cytochrome family protein